MDRSAANRWRPAGRRSRQFWRGLEMGVVASRLHQSGLETAWHSRGICRMKTSSSTVKWVNMGSWNYSHQKKLTFYCIHPLPPSSYVRQSGVASYRLQMRIKDFLQNFTCKFRRDCEEFLQKHAHLEFIGVNEFHVNRKLSVQSLKIKGLVCKRK